MIVGNKSDLKKQREVQQETALEYAEKHKLAFMETSALTATNVDSAFEGLIKGNVFILTIVRDSQKSSKQQKRGSSVRRDI